MQVATGVSRVWVPSLWRVPKELASERLPSRVLTATRYFCLDMCETLRLTATNSCGSARVRWCVVVADCCVSAKLRVHVQASWGKTDGVDARSGTQPWGTRVTNNLCHEIGQFEKQARARAGYIRVSFRAARRAARRAPPGRFRVTLRPRPHGLPLRAISCSICLGT